jgi:hypothetical protein
MSIVPRESCRDEEFGETGHCYISALHRIWPSRSALENPAAAVAVVAHKAADNEISVTTDSRIITLRESSS